LCVNDFVEVYCANNLWHFDDQESNKEKKFDLTRKVMDFKEVGFSQD
jgi:hypothetical protein